MRSRPRFAIAPALACALPFALAAALHVDPATLERPRFAWTPSPGVSNLVFYAGAAFPRWQGQAIVATLAKNDLWRLVPGERGALVAQETLLAGVGRFRDVAVGPHGELLLLLEHRSGSQILRLAPAP